MVADETLDLGGGAQLVLGIVHNITASDDEVGTDEPACANLPDGMTSLCILEARFDLDDS